MSAFVPAGGVAGFAVDGLAVVVEGFAVGVVWGLAVVVAGGLAVVAAGGGAV